MTDEHDLIAAQMRTMMEEERAAFFRATYDILADGLALAEGFALAIGACSPDEVLQAWKRVFISRLRD